MTMALPFASRMVTVPVTRSCTLLMNASRSSLQRIEPQPFVGQFAPLPIHDRLELQFALRADQRFQRPVRGDQHDGGGTLVVLAHFQAEHPVFHDVHAPDAVLARDLVQFDDQVQAAPSARRPARPARRSQSRW